MPNLIDAYELGLSSWQTRELVLLMCANRDYPAWYWWIVMNLAADGDRGMGALLDKPNPRQAC
jgi:hypothetical protein